MTVGRAVESKPGKGWALVESGRTRRTALKTSIGKASLVRGTVIVVPFTLWHLLTPAGGSRKGRTAFPTHARWGKLALSTADKQSPMRAREPN